MQRENFSDGGKVKTGWALRADADVLTHSVVMMEVATREVDKMM